MPLSLWGDSVPYTKKELVHHAAGHQASGEPKQAPCTVPARGEIAGPSGGTVGSASVELCVPADWCLPRNEVPEGPTLLDREECVVGRSGALNERPTKKGF